jgi:hypothetical protein
MRTAQFPGGFIPAQAASGLSGMSGELRFSLDLLDPAIYFDRGVFVCAWLFGCCAGY